MYRNEGFSDESEIIHDGSRRCIPQEVTIHNVRLANAYVPFQKFCDSYSPEEGLLRGTIFSELYSPYRKHMFKDLKQDKRLGEQL